MSGNRARSRRSTGSRFASAFAAVSQYSGRIASCLARKREPSIAVARRRTKPVRVAPRVEFDLREDGAGMKRFVAGCAGVVLLLAALAAQAADMSKILRIAFLTGETGFDP